MRQREIISEKSYQIAKLEILALKKVVDISNAVMSWKGRCNVMMNKIMMVRVQWSLTLKNKWYQIERLAAQSKNQMIIKG